MTFPNECCERPEACCCIATEPPTMKENEAPCPECGWPIAIYYDHPDSVGQNLAGYYLSHAPWVPYPQWTRCPIYKIAQDTSKFDTRNEAETARELIGRNKISG